MRHGVVKVETMKRIFLLLVLALAARSASAFEDARQNAAADLMRRCETVLWEEKLKRVPDFDVRLDPDHTGLVGEEFTALATTPGSWHDKRAAAQPEMAGAVAGYLIGAGVKEWDWFGINGTSSYPGFTMAALCAARTLKLNTVFVLSYGASMYGGTLPRFTVPVMLDALRERGVVDVKIDALTPGGVDDRMRRNVLDEDVLPLVRRLMGERRETCMIPADLRMSMAFRQMLFAAKPIKAFVSCGGSWLSLGRSMEEGAVLPHGLIMPPWPVKPKTWDRGLIMDFLEKGVPCIHLLFTKGVCRDWNLPHGTGPEPNF